MVTSFSHMLPLSKKNIGDNDVIISSSYSSSPPTMNGDEFQPILPTTPTASAAAASKNEGMLHPTSTCGGSSSSSSSPFGTFGKTSSGTSSSSNNEDPAVSAPHHSDEEEESVLDAFIPPPSKKTITASRTAPVMMTTASFLPSHPHPVGTANPEDGGTTTMREEEEDGEEVSSAPSYNRRSNSKKRSNDATDQDHGSRTAAEDTTATTATMTGSSSTSLDNYDDGISNGGMDGDLIHEMIQDFDDIYNPLPFNYHGGGTIDDEGGVGKNPSDNGWLHGTSDGYARDHDHDEELDPMMINHLNPNDEQHLYQFMNNPSSQGGNSSFGDCSNGKHSFSSCGGTAPTAASCNNGFGSSIKNPIATVLSSFRARRSSSFSSMISNKNSNSATIKSSSIRTSSSSISLSSSAASINSTESNNSKLEVVAEPPSHISVEDSLSRELLKLSMDDRNAMEEEIHGVRSLFKDETAESLQKALFEFDVELAEVKSTPRRSAIRGTTKDVLRYTNWISSSSSSSSSNDDSQTTQTQQQSLNNDRDDCYLNDPNVRLRFLRFEYFDAKKAVKRFVCFLEFAQELFGDFVAERPISINDFRKTSTTGTAASSTTSSATKHSSCSSNNKRKKKKKTTTIKNNKEKNDDDAHHHHEDDDNNINNEINMISSSNMRPPPPTASSSSAAAQSNTTDETTTTTNEMKTLMNSRFQYLPFRDRSGRRVCVYCCQCLFDVPTKLRYKIIMYMHWIASEDIETQRKGLVMIFLPSHEELQQQQQAAQSPINMNSSSSSSSCIIPTSTTVVSDTVSSGGNITAGGVDDVWESMLRPNILNRDVLYHKRSFGAIPIRIASMHFCAANNNPIYKILSKLCYFGLPKQMYDLKSRYKTHFGDRIEILYHLQSYGIPVDLLPMTHTGAMKMSNHLQWIRFRKEMDRNQQQQLLRSTTTKQNKNELHQGHNFSQQQQEHHHHKQEENNCNHRSYYCQNSTMKDEIQSLLGPPPKKKTKKEPYPQATTTTSYHHYHREDHQHHHDEQQQQQQQRSSMCPSPNLLVECPRSFDVIFRKGKQYGNHVGNSVLLNMLLDRTYKDHWNAKSQATKVELTWRIVDEIERRGGRFLEWDSKTYNGVWVRIVQNNKKREKIAQCYKVHTRKRRGYKRCSPPRGAASKSTTTSPPGAS